MKPVELKKKPICLFLYRVARNISTMEHIFQEHMLPTARQGASYFLSRDRQTVRGMVTETLETPDEVTPHRSRRDRTVLKKTFPTQVGVHCITNAACYSVTLIVYTQSNILITGFPTHQHSLLWLMESHHREKLLQTEYLTIEFMKFLEAHLCKIIS